MSKPRRYSAEFKLDAVSRMEHCETITGLAKELGIRRKFLYQWRDQLRARRQGSVGAAQRSAARQPVESHFAAHAQCSGVADRLTGTAAGPQTTGAGFFQTSLRTSQGSSGESYQRWRQGIYRSIEASLSFEGEGLTAERQCQLAEVSRAGFYRYLQQSTPVQADLLLRARLQELAVEHRRQRG